MTEKAVFFAEVQELRHILQWVRTHLVKKGVEAKVIRRIELALEEAVVNIANHGYAGKGGRIEIGLKQGHGGVEITISDWGPPFDPLAGAPQVDAQADLEKREAGGLGIFLLRQIMDEIAYRREGNANILTMVKHFFQTK